MMLTVRPPQLKPPKAFSIFSASISAMMSTATTACCPLRGVSRGQEACRAVASQVRHDHAIAGGREQWRDFGEAVDVIGPAVQQDHVRSVGRSRFRVADAEPFRR